MQIFRWTQERVPTGLSGAPNSTWGRINFVEGAIRNGESTNLLNTTLKEGSLKNSLRFADFYLRNDAKASLAWDINEVCDMQLHISIDPQEHILYSELCNGEASRRPQGF